MTRSGIESWSPRPLTNTLPTRPMGYYRDNLDQNRSTPMKIIICPNSHTFTKILIKNIDKLPWPKYTSCGFKFSSSITSLATYNRKIELLFTAGKNISVKFLSLRVFRPLSSYLLLFLQRFGQYVLWPFSGVCQTQEPTQNFELHPSLNPWGSPVLILLAITGYKSWNVVDITIKMKTIVRKPLMIKIISEI